jgi:hypothetical protein
MITIDGSANTIAGLAVGGLPDATITAADLSGAQTGSAPIYGCRAWCVFDGTLTGTNAPTAGGNVSTVTRNSTGDYTINFTTAMPDANYAVSPGGGVGPGNAAFYVGTRTTTTCQVGARNSTTGVQVDLDSIAIAIFR